MKSTAVFLGVLFGLSFLVSGAMLVTATMKPQWFMAGSNEAQTNAHRAQAKKDSLDALARRDSAAAASATAARDTLSPSRLGGSASAAMPVPERTVSAAAAQADSARQDDLQSLVKLYEAMKPQDAAKILAKQNDKDIRAIILHIKKKQAAKILSNFNADRAAQILAQ